MEKTKLTTPNNTFVINIEGQKVTFVKFTKTISRLWDDETNPFTILDIKGFIDNPDGTHKRVIFISSNDKGTTWNVIQNDFPRTVTVERQEALFDFADDIGAMDHKRIIL